MRKLEKDFTNLNRANNRSRTSITSTEVTSEEEDSEDDLEQQVPFRKKGMRPSVDLVFILVPLQIVGPVVSTQTPYLPQIVALKNIAVWYDRY